MKLFKAKLFKRWLILLLVLLFLAAPVQMLPLAEAVYPIGDPNNDGGVDAGDALFVLRAAVDKITPTPEQVLAGDVDASGDDGGEALDAKDALLILQYAVKIISVFPAEQVRNMTEEERFYYNLDQQYKVDYSDFADEIVIINNIDDPQEIVEKLGGDPEAAPVEGYGMTQDNRLAYTPISNEAKRLGTVQKYNKAKTVTGTVKAGNTVVEYSVPTAATAYDAVPITYKVYSTTNNLPIHIEATAFEDPDRYNPTDSTWYELNLPGAINVAFEYEGYMNGDYDYGKPKLNKDPALDVQGTKYPAYATSGLKKSGTIEAGADFTWFKFTYTNTGNTVLDGEGNGAFRFMPCLYKSDGNGGWTYLGTNPNQYYPLLDYVYPGESADVWMIFGNGGEANSYGYAPGDYKIVINGMIRSESDYYNFTANQIGHNVVTTSTFEFSVTEDGEMTQPKEILNTGTESYPRNKWLGIFEEFMASYTTLTKIGNSKATATEGTLYIQLAPWTQQIVLKVINGNSKEAGYCEVPIDIETDSIQINLNEYNNNWVLTEDGTRMPMVYTQNMADMRGNVDRGPYCDRTIINDLRNMKEAGINTITTTHVFTGEYSGLHDMGYYMLDLARAMGFDYEGHCMYNYRVIADRRVFASDDTIDLGSSRDIFGLSRQDSANGILAKWNLIRYGDFYVFNPVTKEIPISIEENYGWMTINLINRYGINNSYSDYRLRSWLKQAYNNDIDLLNETYGSDYDAFKDITVSDQSVTDGVAYVLNGEVYGKEWNAATMELDLFRTAERTGYYKEMLEYLDVENTKVYIRSENGIFLAPGISQTTTNPHYRNIYYEQRHGAAVPEVLAASGVIYGDSGYSHLTLTPSEVYELTRQSAKAGFNTAKTPNFAHGQDYVMNDYVGTYELAEKYNTDDLQKCCSVNRSYSLFTWCKAIYEAGGVPGTMWMDYMCDLYVTTTQYRELQFFTGKIQEMLATDAGKAWATNIPAEELTDPLENISGAYSYSEAYIEEKLESTPRYNQILDFCTKN